MNLNPENILDPREHGLLYYSKAFKTALDSNPSVKGYVEFENSNTPWFHILVEATTDNIKDEMFTFDTTQMQKVIDISAKNPDYENELFEKYDSGLLISLGINTLQKDTEWRPVHPYIIYRDPERDNTLYEILCDRFDTESPSDFKFDETEWVKQALNPYKNRDAKTFLDEM